LYRDSRFPPKCNIIHKEKCKVEEKRENFSLRKLRKPRERESEKKFAPFFEVTRTEREKTFL
jgi:hypothetical protein